MDPPHATPDGQNTETFRGKGQEAAADPALSHNTPTFGAPDQPRFNPTVHAAEVIRLLAEHGIHCCLVGTKALCYYGAPRLCMVRPCRPSPSLSHGRLSPDSSQTLEFCVPTDQLAAADALFSSGPASTSYTAWRGHHPDAEARLPASLYHTFPRYLLNHRRPLFDFYLVPSADWRFDCTRANFEYSAQAHLPYPKLHLFAQSLMERRSFNDLQDLVDGMDLAEAWGDENLRFDDLGEEYARWVADKNDKIRAALPQEVREHPMAVMFGTSMYEVPEGVPKFRGLFVNSVRTKEGRIGIEAPPGQYSTQYREKGSPDPRTLVRFHV